MGGVASGRHRLTRVPRGLPACRRRSSYAALAAAAALVAAGPAQAQQVACVPPNPPNTCTVSTTHGTTTVSVTEPGTTAVAPGQPVLSGQLQAALAGPNGGAIQNALAGLGVLGGQKG
ncbi:hypothetical protein [Pseudorhodoplanes sp.]|uniref:hypothetical protein n=1 Tax=Pseudorhodoplanes sp. TaxID=1934341 RepID=UPI003D128D0A